MRARIGSRHRCAPAHVFSFSPGRAAMVRAISTNSLGVMMVVVVALFGAGLGEHPRRGSTVARHSKEGVSG